MIYTRLTELIRRNKLLLYVAILFCILGIVFKFYPTLAVEQQKLANKTEAYVRSAEKIFFDSSFQQNYHFTSGLDNTDAATLNAVAALPFYVYDVTNSGAEATIISWSDNVVLPTQTIVSAQERIGAILLPNGFYVWMKKPSPQGSFVALLPVKWNYFVTNRYLKNDFVEDLRTDVSANFNIVQGAGTEGNVTNKSGDVLFHFYTSGIHNKYTSILSFIFSISGFFLLLYFLHRVTHKLSHSGYAKISFVIFFSGVILLRIITLISPGLFTVLQWDLYDSSVYHYSPIHRSLGDVLINILLILWVLGTLRFNMYKSNWQFSTKSGVIRFAYITVSALVILYICYSAAYLIRSLVANSRISFDVQNFFSLNYSTVIGIVVLSCISFAVFLSVRLVIFAMHKIYAYHRQPVILALSICGLIYISLLIGDTAFKLYLFVLCWVLLFVFLLSSEKVERFLIKLLGATNIFWFIFFSLSVTTIITTENNIKEIQERKQYALRLAARANPVTELQLKTLSSDINSQFFKGDIGLLLDSTKASAFGQKLIESTTGANNTRYTASLYSFYKNEEAVLNTGLYSFNELNSILETRSKRTAVDDLYVFEASSYEYNYLIRKVIRDSSQDLLGYVFVHIIPATSGSISPYPEIFNKETNKEFSRLNNYSYAVYNDDKLVATENNFPFSTELDPFIFQNKEFALVVNHNTSELWYNAGAGKAVAITKSNDHFIAYITLFSYLFGCSLILYAIVLLLRAFYYSRLDWRLFLNQIKLSLRERLQAIVISLAIFSFIVIGAATIFFFITRYNESNKEKLSNILDSVNNQFQQALQLQGLADSTSQNIIPGVDSANLSAIFSKIATINDVELNLYGTQGDLRFSSLPLPYEKGIFSNRMSPAAFIALHNEHAIQFFQNEKIGSLSYLSCYRALMNKNGETYAYLNTPYFKSQNALKEEISDFLVAIINLNAFVFLIGSILALYTTNRITRAFSLIAEKMKAINIGKDNDLIEWNYDDEIGILIREYNTMVLKLESSALKLVKTERESAWQEMAKQVAHEIKNPLTPMMLSIQYLQKQIEADAPNIKALTESTANTIVQQIEHLSHMAGEFSRFAQIDTANKEKINLQDSLLHLKDLYASVPYASFSWHLLDEPIWIFADKSQITRLFTNLLQNALQSSDTANNLIIEIKETIEDDHVALVVKDNGDGIPVDIREKIFQPNFTTKSSGTGLGLAMCKRIAEVSGGDIDFITGDEGTSFTVKLPIINNY